MRTCQNSQESTCAMCSGLFFYELQHRALPVHFANFCDVFWFKRSKIWSWKSDLCIHSDFVSSRKESMRHVYSCSNLFCIKKKEPFCNHVRKWFIKISVIINYFLCFICKEKPLRMGIPVTITYVKLFFTIVYQIVTLAKCWGVFSVFKACTIQRRIQNMKNVYNGVFGENN